MVVLATVAVAIFASPAHAASENPPASSSISFEQAIADLASRNADDRLRAATLLKASAYPEAAIPLAAAVLDSQDAVQFEAIAAELNIFLAKKIVPKKKVGLVVEVRARIAAEPTFSAGPLALGTQHVPMEVLTALRTAARDDNRRVGLEALYAFGALASEPTGAPRRDLQQASGAELAAMVGSPDESLRAAAVRVIGRVFESHAGDDEADEAVGDVIITALNDQNRAIKRAAMDTLGAMRYSRGVDALTQLFQYYKQGDLAEGALDALSRIAHPASLPLLQSLLASKSPAMKTMAIEGLARAGDRSQMAAIDGSLNGERNERVVFAGTFASAMLGDGSLERLTDSLLQPRLRDVSKQYLAEIARGRADRLGRYAQDPDPGVRADIADVLGFSGDAAAQPIVESLIKDQNQQVAVAAERAAMRLRGTGAGADH